MEQNPGWRGLHRLFSEQNGRVPSHNQTTNSVSRNGFIYIKVASAEQMPKTDIRELRFGASRSLIPNIMFSQI